MSELLYVVNGRVFATHPENQNVPASAYGPGCTILPPQAEPLKLGDLAPSMTSAADLNTYASFKRWLKEINGITVSTVPVATDDRSKMMVMGARLAAQANPAFNTPWVGSDGNAYPLTAAQVIAISDAVQAHVANCFATYATIKPQIDSGAITATAQIDTAFAAINTKF